MTLLFFLGQTRELCWAELEAVCGRFQLPQPQKLTDDVALVDLEGVILPVTELPFAQHLQNILGGTVKIAELAQKTGILPHAELENTTVELLQAKATKRFAIAEHNRDNLKGLNGGEIKKLLRNAGHAASYTDSPRSGVNAAVLKNRHVDELQVVQTETEIFWAWTAAWQDVDEWSFRDVGKPKRDRQRGMLSPKVARMMLNIAIGSEDPEFQTVLDPFCGMGTILIEATMLGVPKVLGNDISSEAILATEENLRWWKNENDTPFEHICAIKPTEKLDLSDLGGVRPTCIVTEPFLGKLTPEASQVPGIIRGLEKLYKGSLRAFTRLLLPHDKVVMIFPAFQGKRDEILSLDHIIHDLPEIGFKVVAGPWRGGRPSAHTQRQIYVLEYVPYVTR